MKRIISLLLCFLLTFTLCPSVFAAGDTMTWTGTSSDNWNVAGNWNPARVPGAGDTADIPASTVAAVVYDTTSVTLDCSGEVSVESGKTLWLTGTSYLKGGKLSGDGDVTIIVNDSNLLWSGGSIEGNGTFTVGENTRLVIDTVSDVGMSRPLENNGQVMLTNGELLLMGGGTGTGTFTVSGGAYLHFRQGNYSIGGDFVNSGEMTIWNKSSVCFDADYWQEDESTLVLKVWGDGSDQYRKLDVAGAATLGGILEIDFIKEYAPLPGDSFEIVTCGSRANEFSEIRNNMEDVGITLVPTYTDTGLTLTVVAASGNVCTIGATEYATLDVALTVVQSGDTIKLLQNIDYTNNSSSAAIVNNDKNITFDLSGHTLNINNSAGVGVELLNQAEMLFTGGGVLIINAEGPGLYIAGSGSSGSNFESGETVTVTIVSSNGAGIQAYTSTVDIQNGSASGRAHGIRAYHDNTITVNGPVTSADSHAVFLGGANNTVNVGSAAVTGGTKGDGVHIEYGGSVTVGSPASPGSVTGKNVGIYTMGYTDRTHVTVYGDVEGVSYGICAFDNAEIKVYGDVTSTSTTNTEACGVYTFADSGPSSLIEIDGNVEGQNGVKAEGSSISVNVTGNVTANSSNSVNSYGVFTQGTVVVGGNVNATGCIGAAVGVNSQITVDGVITALKYVKLGASVKTIDDKTFPTTKTGYHTYNNGTATVWVKDSGTAEFAGGDGSEDNPYLIATPEHLNNVRNYLGAENADKHFKLTANLNLNVAPYNTGEGWEPIGASDDFTGSFDGGGHTISGLVINRPAQDDIGLFAYAETTAKIRNLGLVGVKVTGSDCVGGLVGGNRGQVTNSYVTGDVTGKDRVGGLVGQNFGSNADSYATGIVTDTWSGSIGGLAGENSANGTITNCHAEVTVTSSNGVVGGLVGNNFGAITKSHAVGNVEGLYGVGGLVGINNEGNIDKSYATGTVTGTETGISYTLVGGLVGSNTGPISDSFARGAVSGQEDIGGLVGYNSSSITNSYATGAVSGDSYIGGLVGFNHSDGIITGSYWDTETSHQTSSDGGVGKSTTEMKQQETYDGWDFAATWVINASDNDGYPFLAVPTAPTVPTVPQSLTATSGNGQVALSWAAPASDGGSAITKYQVSEDNGANWTDVGLNTSHTFNGLTNGTAYTFKVRAVNSAGSGAEASATATPTAAPAPTYTVTVTNGTGGGEFAQGVSVTITANPALAGQRFKEWQVISGGITLVNSQEASTSFQMPANAVAITAAYEPIPETTYTVTVNGSYAATTGAGSYEQGATVTISAGSRSSYTFAGWTSSDGVTFTNANNATTIFTMPDKDVTITANWSYKVSSGGSSGGGSSTPTTPTAPAYKADVKIENGTETTLPVTVDKDTGTASVDAGSQGLDQGGTIITIPPVPDIDTYSVGIPVPDLSTSDIQGTLTVNTDAGSVTVPSNMLTGVSGVSGSKAQITIGQGDKSGLPKNIRDAIGDRPLVQLTLSIDGKRTDWSNPNAPVTISIPYAPTAAELANPESIVIWYIDGNGKAVSVPNGHYDPETGTVTFTTTHFSYYAVSYNHMSFKDVANDAWYAKAVSFIAAREITTGTGGGNFSPEAKLTRGQFIVMLMKAYDIAPDANPRDNFSDAGGTYYTGYLAAAKRLGISAGIGNNMFTPEKEITRQEMFTLLYNALKVIGQLPQGDSDKTLDHFSDAGQIDSWAKEAMTLLVKTGTIGGNAGKLNPTSTTTRAEMAQVLYNLLSK